jgi:hypothetical protein
MLSSAGLAGLSFATPKKNAMVLDEVRKVVGSALQLGGRLQHGEAVAPLLGASTFETLGSLVLFIERKVSA